MHVVETIPTAIRLGARARWGDGIRCQMAPPTGRALGPVFTQDQFLVQRVSDELALVHRADNIEFGTSERLRVRAGQHRLTDLMLAIYSVNGATTAYLRSTMSAPPRARRTPVVTPLRTMPHRARRPLGRRSATTVAGAVASALSLASCSTHSLLTPDGHDRVAINSPESLTQYQTLLTREDAAAREKSALERQVEELKAELVALKATVEEQQRHGPLSKTTSHHQSGAALVVRPSPRTPVVDGPGAVTALGAGRLVFRISQAYGSTAFTPAPAIEERLLNSARSARRIVIRGRTDSETVSETQRRVALGRALNAREYLVTHGVEPGKIRLWYRSSGGFIADNSTAHGRALNRRVEIETRGLAASAYTPVAAEVHVRTTP